MRTSLTPREAVDMRSFFLACFVACCVVIESAIVMLAVLLATV